MSSENIIAGRILPVATKTADDLIGSLVSLKGAQATLSG